MRRLPLPPVLDIGMPSPGTIFSYDGLGRPSMLMLSGRSSRVFKEICVR